MISHLKFNTWISLVFSGISLACSSSEGEGIPEDDDPGTPQAILLDDSRNLGVNFNGLYANRTVEPDPDTGKFQFNYAWAEDFIAIQDNEYQD
ncbi:hypothetical protein [Sinomicrobium soli]|uniref:hypothetical protein n=1 Tax=Sinomicrobium sp. N-1-3-6 TaxID=2219864 RepID=UPI000DCBB054|nr:hypothetical protein [Sinomicrobium sp. N-1-3-6]RAV29370.1 hypothetical protein DN748_07630 [Sinomicrobium sp. N-1-3-6]